MEENRYITLVIHTYDRAVTLKQVLESNGIDVRLQNVNLTQPTISSGVRVRISERDLPLALKITESADPLSPALYQMRLSGMSGNILVPVDFSEYSIIACNIGFSFAKTLGLHLVLLHAFETPYFKGVLPFSDHLNSDLREADIRLKLEKEANKKMKEFISSLKKKIAKNELPNIGFSSIVREGVPEVVIQDYVKNSPPSLIIMATREKNKKEQDLIGSVTAEVMDSCRVPVLSVPESIDSCNFSDAKNIIFFCNVDQQDLLAMDSFLRLFCDCQFNITLVPVNERAGNQLGNRAEVLLSYFKNQYPGIEFNCKSLPQKMFRKKIIQLINDDNVKLLVVPNKKKSIFSRLINPSIAHKMLFEKDIPILVLPV